MTVSCNLSLARDSWTKEHFPKNSLVEWQSAWQPAMFSFRMLRWQTASDSVTETHKHTAVQLCLTEHVYMSESIFRFKQQLPINFVGGCILDKWQRNQAEATEESNDKLLDRPDYIEIDIRVGNATYRTPFFPTQYFMGSSLAGEGCYEMSKVQTSKSFL